MKFILLGILGIGLLLIVIVIAVVVGVLKKGVGFLFGRGHGYRKYSSSGWKNPHHSGGHSIFGHGHYRKRHSSHSFFSS